MFARVAPDLVENPNDSTVNTKLGTSLYRISYPNSKRRVILKHDDFQTVRVQFQALQLIKTSYLKTTKGAMALFWSLTNRGERLMLQMRTIEAVSDNRKACDG